jgi:hypothetical protein
MTFAIPFLEAAHRHCTSNRAEIEASEVCACFYCKGTFPPSQVTQWIPDEGGDTALCPLCPVDSVLGSASGLPVEDPDFRAAMHEHWFERTVNVED